MRDLVAQLWGKAGAQGIEGRIHCCAMPGLLPGQHLFKASQRQGGLIGGFLMTSCPDQKAVRDSVGDGPVPLWITGGNRHQFRPDPARGPRSVD